MQHIRDTCDWLMCGCSQRANPPTSSASHNTHFFKAYTSGFSASQHFSTKSRSRTPREVAIRCSFKMLIFRIPRSTPDMNVQCSPAFSASCSCVNPNASRRARIVCPRGFLGSVLGSSTHRCLRFQPGEYIVYSLCRRGSQTFK
jgi:hypothetical protein